MVKKIEEQVKTINYERLYCDFIDELESCTEHAKGILKREVSHLLNGPFSYKHLYKINAMIYASMGINKENTTGVGINAYDKAYVTEILSYQKRFNLSNLEVSSKFKISRNTIAKWKRVFKHIKTNA